jgi:hypothetical protein
MNDLNDALVLVQQNWEWIFALICVGLYFRHKTVTGSKEPTNKLEEIGQKAEKLVTDKAEEFVEEVEEKALDALEEKLDSLSEEAIEVVETVIELSKQIEEPKPVRTKWSPPLRTEDMDDETYDRLRKEYQEFVISEGYEFSPLNGFPDPSLVSRARKCPCGSDKLYKNCHQSYWIPSPE